MPRFFITLFIVLITAPSYAAGDVPLGWALWTTPSGQSIMCPNDWAIVEGRNHKAIAVPHGWTSRQGADGQAVAVPPDFVWAYDDRGRIFLIAMEPRLTDACETYLQKIPRDPRTQGRLLQLLKAIGPGPCSD